MKIPSLCLLLLSGLHPALTAQNLEITTVDGRRLQVEVGDKVLLPEYGGAALTLGDEEFHLFRGDEILGKFSE